MIDIGKCGTCKWWQQPRYTNQSDTRHCKRHAPVVDLKQMTFLDEHNKPVNPDWDLNRYWPITRDTDGCGDFEGILS